MRRADQDGVDVARFDHGADIGEGVLTFLKRRNGAVTLAEAGNLESGNLARTNVSKMGFAHVAESNDAESDDFHSVRMRVLVRAGRLAVEAQMVKSADSVLRQYF
jgi:uncharacterized protein (DUF362 family)